VTSNDADSIPNTEMTKPTMTHHTLPTTIATPMATQESSSQPNTTTRRNRYPFSRSHMLVTIMTTSSTNSVRAKVLIISMHANVISF
jgi:hypothetical protein